MELVALNVGLDIGVLTEQVFAAFVVMAIWFFSPTPHVPILLYINCFSQEYFTYVPSSLANMD